MNFIRASYRPLVLFLNNPACVSSSHSSQIWHIGFCSRKEGHIFWPCPIITLYHWNSPFDLPMNGCRHCCCCSSSSCCCSCINKYKFPRTDSKIMFRIYNRIKCHNLLMVQMWYRIKGWFPVNLRLIIKSKDRRRKIQQILSRIYSQCKIW